MSPLHFLTIFNAKLKSKFVPVLDIKAHKGSRGIAPLNLDVLARWPLYPRVIRQAPTEQKAGLAPKNE